MYEVEKTGTLSIPNEAARIPEARLFVRSFLMDVEASEEDVFDILVAIEEAATNALRHSGRRQGDGRIGIRCNYSPAEFIVEVFDDGTGFTYQPKKYRQMPDPLSPGGRGLFLMNKLMDTVDVASTAGGTVVTMTRRLHGVDDAPADTSHDRTFESGSADMRSDRTIEPGVRTHRNSR